MESRVHLAQLFETMPPVLLRVKKLSLWGVLLLGAIFRVACAATWGHGDVWVHAAPEGHVWAHGPTVTVVCAIVHGPCCCQMWMSVVSAADSCWFCRWVSTLPPWGHFGVHSLGCLWGLCLGLWSYCARSCFCGLCSHRSDMIHVPTDCEELGGYFCCEGGTWKASVTNITSQPPLKVTA